MIKYELVIPRASKGRAESSARLLRARGFPVEVRAIDDYADIHCATATEAMNEYRSRTGVSLKEALDWVRAHPEAWEGGV